MAEQQASVGENIYHIRVQGDLHSKWADWFQGFVMTSRGNGETLLTGAVDNQAALHSALGKIHNLGLPLLLVAQTGCPCSSKRCPKRGQCRECAAYEADRGRLPFCLRAKSRWDKQCVSFTAG